VAGFLIESDQPAAADIEVQPVQREHAPLLALANKREASKMRERGANAGRFEGGLLTVNGNVVFSYLRVVEQCEPAADEALRFGLISDLLPVRPDAAAARPPKKLSHVEITIQKKSLRVAVPPAAL
jgi:hypothetical protein